MLVVACNPACLQEFLTLLLTAIPHLTVGINFCVLYFSYTMKSRTRSNNQVITLRQTIKAAMKDAPSVALYDAAVDPRHLAALLATA